MRKRFPSLLLLFCISLLFSVHSCTSFLLPLVQHGQCPKGPEKQPLRRFQPSSRPWPTIQRLPVNSVTSLMGIKGFRGWFESQFPSAMVGFRTEGAHEKFDHVLIDINQLLHTSLRKSNSDNHGLVLLMKELDACVQMATPTQTLVLAMDGPPGAAKLSTQRQRRKSVVTRSKTKINQLERMVEGTLGKRKLKKSVLTRRKRKASAELRTLSITPGTEFMDKAAQAILYWAWQRMSNPKSPLSRVQIFLSPSTVPGEGEVKILEWIYAKRRKGSSIAILGGDSDLVLEVLIIPPTSTHDIFVLLPDGPRNYLAVSLWETTRALQKNFIKHMTMANMMKVRTDLVVLFILNGNDYLPKLRGSSGFSKLVRAYTKLHNQWHLQGRAHKAFLVDPDLLTFNLDFCIEYFSYLSQTSPMAQLIDDSKATFEVSSLSKLNSLADAGFLPKPIVFSIVDEENGNDFSNTTYDNQMVDDLEYSETEEKDHDADFDEEEEDDDDDGSNEQVLLKLTLGVDGTEDSYTYEQWWPKNTAWRLGRHNLADLAISDLLGIDPTIEDVGDDDEVEVEANSLFEVAYDWESKSAADAKVDSYLYGLLWNVQTYQDGICADYGYNYGRRKSPTAEDVMVFLKQAQEENQSLGPKTLSKGRFTPPINAGLSCLAALPSEVRELIPEPYNRIPEGTVEEIYAKCVDDEDNSFDIVLFKRLCEEELSWIDDAELQLSNSSTVPYIRCDSWTVMARSRKFLNHPFDPPAPFDDHFSKLRRDRSIRIFHYPTIVEPRQRDHHGHHESSTEKARSGSSTRLPIIVHSSPGRDFLKLSIDDVMHRAVYTNCQKVRRKAKMEKGVDADLRTHDVDIQARLQKFNLQLPPKSPERNKDGMTAMLCLKQLVDGGILGSIEWDTKQPSDSDFASFDPPSFEKVTLRIRPAEDGSSVLSSLMEFSQDREIRSMSKKQIQQHLASLALDSLYLKQRSSTWRNATFDDIKRTLSNKRACRP